MNNEIGVTTPFYCNDGKGNFLFHKRSSQCRDEQGVWDAGGGKLEFGLTVEENVLKEVMEEYGCKGTIQKQLPAHSVLRKHNGKKTHWVAVPFFILIDPKQVKINDTEKIDELKWCRLDNLPHPLHVGFQYTFNKYQSYFQSYML